MAQYRFSPAIVSRGGGKSIIAKAAYNAREAIRDERTGELKDYSRKSGGVEFSGIFAPKNAPVWVTDRARPPLERHRTARGPQHTPRPGAACPEALSSICPTN